MKIIAPDYYKDFSCIADKCNHNCCIGWEIDIDEDSLKYYKTIKSDFGDKLNKNICTDVEVPYFVLAEKERCPFLNDNNLCEIYINLGEEHLCQICSDHPRFRNFFDFRIEIGIGLACEEAARLIITKESPMQLICIDNDDESEMSDDEVFLNFRQKIFSILQNRKLDLHKRIINLCDEFDIPKTDFKIKDIIKLYSSLEILDEVWLEKLEKLNDCTYNFSSDVSMIIPEEQLLIYFLYRHLPEAQYDGLYKERIMFSVLSVIIIDMLYYAHSCKSIKDLIEFSRMYSAEIEYSEDNINKILEFLKLED